MSDSPSPFDLLREIQPSLKELDSIPLTATASAFPWEEFSGRLARSLDREGLKIVPGEIAWRGQDDLYEGLGDSLFPLHFTIPSLRGKVCWVMPEQEIAVLATLLLTKESHPLPLYDRELNESFYQFLAMEALYHFTQLPFDKGLSPVLTHETHLPKEDALCLDISIHLKEQVIWGRFIISPEFRRSWADHFAQKSEASPLFQEMGKSVNVILHIDAGKTDLQFSDWKKMKLGDILVLDRCSIDVEKGEGRVVLSLDGKNVFRGKLKDGALKILELPLLREVETSMAKEPEDEFEDELSDLDFLDEHTVEESDEGLTDFTEETTSNEENHADEENLAESGQGKDNENNDTRSVQEVHASDFSLIDPDKMPVSVIVEVGQISLPMEQLLKLEPGNLLDVTLHPQNGVDLTVNGKTIGKGELIRLGEVIGVRILQLGRK